MSVTPVIHNWWDIKDQNAQLVELIMFFKVSRQPCNATYVRLHPALVYPLTPSRYGHGAQQWCTHLCSAATYCNLDMYLLSALSLLLKTFKPLQNIALIGALLFYLGGQARRLRVN